MPALARARAVEPAGATVLDIDVHTAPVRGAITFNGAALPAGCYWNLRSLDVASASFVLDAAGAYSGRVPVETTAP